MKTTQSYFIGEALDLLTEIPDKYINLILSDLPYGITQSKWDIIIPFEPLWKQYERIIKDDGVIVLTANQPFTSLLITSNPELFRYVWTWNKSHPTGFLNSKKQPLRVTEDIAVFYKKCCKYNPQMIDCEPYYRKKASRVPTTLYGKFKNVDVSRYEKYPTNLLKFQSVSKTLHVNQKPTELFEYIIKTYTDEGDIVHDSTMGSGVTMEACRNLKRNFIGFEKEQKYEEIYKFILEGKSLEQIYDIFKSKSLKLQN